MKQEKVAIIGLGYVGLPLLITICEKNYNVIGIDIDKEKIEIIKSGRSPFNDQNISNKLKLTHPTLSSCFDSIIDRDIIIICVPTPINKMSTPDYSYIMAACGSISKYLRKNQLIVLESTVNPGSTEEIVIPILENGSKLKAGKDFLISYVPERINPGDKTWSVENIPRVAGSLESKGLMRTISFYSKIVNATITPMDSIKEAEAVKIVENCFRDVNIAFVNELAILFASQNINLPNVIRGAATKPFSWLSHYPGCGVGGHCIPVDPYYLIYDAQKKGYDCKLLKNARNINKQMPLYVVDLLKQSLVEAGIKSGKQKVAVLGLTYKPNVDDVRESPALEICEILKKQGYVVVQHDPFITNNSLDDVLKNTQMVVVCTAHDEYKKISPDYLIDRGVKIVIDGRNCLNYDKFKKSSLIYKGIGC